MSHNPELKILGVIGARSGSKGVPHKNIRPIAGKPLLAWIIGTAKSSRYINRIIVCTDSEGYAKIARAEGAEVPYIQPADVSQDHSTDYEYVRYAVDWLEKNEGYKPDVVVRLMPTVPLQMSEDVDACIEELLKDDKAHSAMVVAEARQIPSKAMKVGPEGYLVSYTTGSAKGAEPTKREIFEKAYFRANVVVTRPSVMRATSSLSGERVRYHVIPQERAIDIDSEIDFHIAEKLLPLFRKKKTFFITCSDGQAIRNWLFGDFYKFAKNDPNISLVAFVPPDRLEDSKIFEHERCRVETVNLDLEWKPKKIFRIACFGCVPTSTIWSRNNFSYLHGGSVFNLVVKQFFWALGHFRVWRAFMRWVEFKVFRDDKVWEPFFDKFKPDAVFAAGILNDEDFTLLKQAKRRGIPSMGMMKSWDNFTSKGFLRVYPDLLLVQNPTMVEEAVRFNNFPRERIRVTGFPQWDHYLDPAWEIPREEFAQKFGIDASKKWITYFAGGLMTGLFGIPDKGDYVLMMKKAIEEGKLGDSTVLIRAHPGHQDLMVPETRVFPNLDFAKGWTFGEKDIRMLANLVRHSDVTINLGSTMSLEAAIFGKPTVLVAFNKESGSKPPAHMRLATALDSSLHFVRVLQTGGNWRVNSEEELIKAVRAYLDNPSLHQEGRKRIVRELVGPVDGRAGRRCFDLLCEVADKKINYGVKFY